MTASIQYVTPLFGTRLSTHHRVGNYYKMLANRDRAGIAGLIKLRLEERYVFPVEHSKQRNGFASMALSCLLIETIQCFRDGKEDTTKKGAGAKAFREYFAWNQAPNAFSGLGQDFYANVRCGILHQGETKKGWTITRKVGLPLFDSARKQVHAEKFLKAVNESLEAYCRELEQTMWNDPLWGKCRDKMKFIIKHCKQ